MEAVPNKFKSKLIAGKANAFLSFSLASLIHTLPLPLVEIQQHARLTYSTSTQADQSTMAARLKRPEFRALMTQLEFDSIVRQIDRTAL
jgi:5'-3' exonuclease